MRTWWSIGGASPFASPGEHSCCSSCTATAKGLRCCDQAQIYGHLLDVCGCEYLGRDEVECCDALAFWGNGPWCGACCRPNMFARRAVTIIENLIYFKNNYRFRFGRSYFPEEQNGRIFHRIIRKDVFILRERGPKLFRDPRVVLPRRSSV